MKVNFIISAFRVFTPSNKPGVILTPWYQSKVKERFEKNFGQNRSIPAACATRWNSTLHQLLSIVQLNLTVLTEICGNNFSKVIFTARGWGLVNEVCDVLKPFANAITQGNKTVTISFVIPTILDLNSHLKKMPQCCSTLSCFMQFFANFATTSFLWNFSKL